MLFFELHVSHTASESAHARESKNREKATPFKTELKCWLNAQRAYSQNRQTRQETSQHRLAMHKNVYWEGCWSILAFSDTEGNAVMNAPVRPVRVLAKERRLGSQATNVI